MFGNRYSKNGLVSRVLCLVLQAILRVQNLAFSYSAKRCSYSCSCSCSCSYSYSYSYSCPNPENRKPVPLAPASMHSTLMGVGQFSLRPGVANSSTSNSAPGTIGKRARLVVPRVMAPRTSPEPATQGSMGFGSRRKSVDFSSRRVLHVRDRQSLRGVVCCLASGSDAFCRPILTGWATHSFGDSLTLPAEAGRGRNSARGVSRCTIKTPLSKS